MKAMMTIADPRQIEVQLVMTTTVTDWAKIAEQLEKGGPIRYGPAAVLFESIREARRRMYEKYDVTAITEPVPQ